MDCARCQHPQADHATGVCLHTLECLCRGFESQEDYDQTIYAAVEPTLPYPEPDEPCFFEGDEGWEDEEDRDMAELEDAIQNCGLEESGWCSLAGTEHCSFRCRFRQARKD